MRHILASVTLVGIFLLGACGDSGGGSDDDGEPCTPDCSGKSCGDDTCGGSCGECDGSQVCGSAGSCTEPTTQALSFFVSSINNGAKGGDLGGVAGADARCTTLAEQAGVSGKTWRAYLSTASESARSRIGNGPWTNAADQVVAADLDTLHQSGLASEHVIDEYGGVIDLVNAHDVITGSDQEGEFDGRNCKDYTSSDPTDEVAVGHADGGGVGQESPESWNAAHVTNCDQEGMQKTAGQGHIYCFAQ